MNQASHLNMEIPMLLPGIKVALSPTDYRVMKQLQLERFDGEQRRLFGGVIEASAR
jgi:branched-chain amino acid transport system substrate-binding protein